MYVSHLFLTGAAQQAPVVDAVQLEQQGGEAGAGPSAPDQAAPTKRPKARATKTNMKAEVLEALRSQVGGVVSCVLLYWMRGW